MISINKKGEKIVDDDDVDKDEIFEPYSYLKIKTKDYRMSGEQNCMIQMIDETKNIMYQDSRGKNKFLQMINATVSHELRNPLNSIIQQNLETHYNHKQIAKII